MDFFKIQKVGVEISCLDINSRGSGFILREDGLIGTNWHVIHDSNTNAQSRSIKVKCSDGSMVEATRVTAAQEQDYAIIKVDKKFEFVPPLANFIEVQPYQEAYFMGRGLDVPTLSLHHGWISAKTQKDGVDVLQIDGPVNQGNSGGGVFDREGRLVGIITQTEAKFDSDLQLLWQLMPHLTQGGNIEMFGIRLPETLRRIIYYLDRNRHVGIGYAFSIDYIKEALGKV